MSPFEVTLVITIVILALYGVHGLLNFNRHATADSFFLNNRNLSPANVRNTFAGAAVSISTVLMFFLTIGINFGWYVLLSPITLALGVLVFSYLIYPALKKDDDLQMSLKGDSENPISSLKGLIDHLYESKSISTIVTAISAVGVLSILVAEMMVGVTIYEQYFIKPEYIVFIIAATLFAYAGLGGMRSVVTTDKWQVIFIIISLSTILIALATDVSKNNIDFGLFDWQPKMDMPLALMANILIVNLCFLPSSLRVWQVVVASSKISKFKMALWQATAIILFVTIAALVISKGVLLVSGEQNATLTSIFNYLVGNNASWISFVVYPLFVAALISALVSTADSAILPLAQALQSIRNKQFNMFSNAATILFLLCLVIAAYFIVTVYFDMGLVSWILTVFSISTGIAPIIVAPLLFGRRKLKQAGVVLIAIGAIISFLFPLWWSIKYSGDFSVQPWNCVIGFSIATLITFVAFMFFEDKNVLEDTGQEE